MGYSPDTDKVSLDDLRTRIEETDLVPSRISLLDKIGNKFETLKKHGYFTFSDLRRDLKNAKNIPAVSGNTGIDPGYLVLLRREIESYLPKPVPVGEFDWFPEKIINKLKQKGYKNSALLYDALNSTDRRQKLSGELGIDIKILNDLFCLADLTRIQWVNHTAARMLFIAGHKDVPSVATADAEKMCDELDRVNREYKFYDGKIGLRDIQRLVKAASYV